MEEKRRRREKGLSLWGGRRNTKKCFVGGREGEETHIAAKGDRVAGMGRTGKKTKKEVVPFFVIRGGSTSMEVSSLLQKYSPSADSRR